MWPLLLACSVDDPPPPPENQDTASEDVDTAPPARCGDGTQDEGEACDDANLWGGDGCSPGCEVETGTPESEPNDTWDAATPAGAEVQGALPAGDVDCWSFAVARCEAVTVLQEGECASSLVLALHAPDGALVAVGAPGEDGCARLDPADQPGARWVAEGTWSVCVEAVGGAVVPTYTLAPSASASAKLDPGVDLDADGEPDTCDLDRDGDGVADVEDTCPDLSNGPDTPALALGGSGYVRTWISAGPYTGDTHTGGCRPSEVARVGEDGVVLPTVGEVVGHTSWVASLLGSDSFDLLPLYGGVSAPREAYAFVYLDSPVARSATLSVGADDGVFAWWNGVRVLDVDGCQGVNLDQFQAPVEVVEGGNTLLLKVYDQGGGWGLAARVLDTAGAPLLDLVPALDPDGTWRADQTDTDGDGVGDLCE